MRATVRDDEELGSPSKVAGHHRSRRHHNQHDDTIHEVSPSRKLTYLLVAVAFATAFAAGVYTSPAPLEDDRAAGVASQRGGGENSGADEWRDFDRGELTSGEDDRNDDGSIRKPDGSGEGEEVFWDNTLPDGTKPIFNSTFANYLTSGMRRFVDENRNKTRKQHYVYDSPYEERWPNSTQPWWSKKVIPFNKYIGEDRQLCFVHVGKTGGSTVGCMLGFSLHCEADNDIKGILPIVTTHAFHRGINDCPDGAKYHLFVVRDPVARMLSDINYERPNMTEADPCFKSNHAEQLYRECNFLTLQELAKNGLMNLGRDEMSTKCRNRAYDAITGEVRYLQHGYFNYQYYTQFAFGTENDLDAASTIPENANIFVIRNTHMVDDYNTINRFLGGKPDVLTADDIPRNNVHDKNSTELYLSKSSKIALCGALCNEIQVYKDILRRAINLDEDDVAASLEELKEVCPVEAKHSSCRERRPDIRRKVEKVRGEDKEGA